MKSDPSDLKYVSEAEIANSKKQIIEGVRVIVDDAPIAVADTEMLKYMLEDVVETSFEKLEN